MTHLVNVPTELEARLHNNADHSAKPLAITLRDRKLADLQRPSLVSVDEPRPSLQQCNRTMGLPDLPQEASTPPTSGVISGPPNTTARKTVEAPAEPASSMLKAAVEFLGSLFTTGTYRICAFGEAIFANLKTILGLIGAMFAKTPSMFWRSLLLIAMIPFVGFGIIYGLVYIFLFAIQQSRVVLLFSLCNTAPWLSYVTTVCGNGTIKASPLPALDVETSLVPIYRDAAETLRGILADDTVVGHLEMYQVATTTFANDVATSKLSPEIKEHVKVFAAEMELLHRTAATEYRRTLLGSQNFAHFVITRQSSVNETLAKAASTAVVIRGGWSNLIADEGSWLSRNVKLPQRLRVSLQTRNARELLLENLRIIDRFVERLYMEVDSEIAETTELVNTLGKIAGQVNPLYTGSS